MRRERWQWFSYSGNPVEDDEGDDAVDMSLYAFAHVIAVIGRARTRHDAASDTVEHGSPAKRHTRARVCACGRRDALRHHALWRRIRMRAAARAAARP
ncbi:hypothetical protein BLAT2472_80237 [Burkholderia latens]